MNDVQRAKVLFWVAVLGVALASAAIGYELGWHASNSRFKSVATCSACNGLGVVAQ